MLQSFLDFFDSLFPIRPESAGNPLAIWLDRFIYGSIFLTALAAPISIAVTNIGWILGVVLWGIRLFVRPRPKFFRTPLDFALVGFFLWSVFSSAFSYAPDLSFDRVKGFSHFLIVYLAAQHLRHFKSIKMIVGTLIFACLVTVGWTFIERPIGRGMQIYGVKPDGVLGGVKLQDGDTLVSVNGKKLREPQQIEAAARESEKIKLVFYRPDYYAPIDLISRDLNQNASAAEMLGFAEWKRAYNWRSQGFYSHYTTYSEALQLIMSLALGILLTLPNKKSRLAVVLIVGLAGMGAALLLTATRASQGGFLISALAIFLLGSSRKVFLLLLALALPLALAASLYLQQTRNTGFVDSADTSTTWRTTVWREGFDLLTKSPRHLIVGVGIDAQKRFRCEWGLFANCTLPPGHFHSTPLQIAVETGLPALFLWLLAVFQYGRTAFRTMKEYAAHSIERGILLGAFGGLLGFFAAGFVHYNLGDGEVAKIFYLIMGIALALWLQRDSKQSFNNQ
jgi:O-antigen ligase